VYNLIPVKIGVFVTIVPLEDITFSIHFRSEQNTGDILILRRWIRKGGVRYYCIEKMLGRGLQVGVGPNFGNLSHKKAVLFLSSSFPDGK
jgi:hypothetical protein